MTTKTALAPLVLEGQRVKKGLTFKRKGYRVDPECVILKNTGEGQITYVRERNRFDKSAQVSVDREVFAQKFDGWCESRSVRLSREAEISYRQEQRDAAHVPALLENFIFDAARAQGGNGDVLRQALTEALAAARQEGYEEGQGDGYSEGRSDGYAEGQNESGCECC